VRRRQRPCLGTSTARCAALTTNASGRCNDCYRAFRGTTTERGYGAEHGRLRAEWEPIVATGTVTCWRCEQLITGPDFDLGHREDRTAPAQPEHRVCNRATSGRRKTLAAPKYMPPDHADDNISDADAELRGLIREGFEQGIPVEKLAEAAGLSAPRVHQIRDGRR